ncbi:MAG: cobalamin B12-binding domain-containing protein [Magnetospirillum sp.]|nr:cobalamin B12-binding domain-containing protein [Magnetospirillum sp.]
MIAKRLMLIEPPFYRLYKKTFALVKYPLGLGYLAAVAMRDTDWTVQAYNADFCADNEAVSLGHMAGQGYETYLASLRDPASQPVWGEVKAAIAEFRPGVVGISAKTQNFACVRLVARLVKELDPTIPVIVGGPHASMARAQLLECPDIDVVAIGEGEETLVELLRTLEAGKDLARVNGIVFRGDDGRTITTPPRLNLPDLDTLPFPHSSAPAALKDYDKYPPGAFRFVFATRGCPYGCEFCGSRNIWSRKVRYRSPANVIAELKALRALGVKSVHFDDDTFGIARKNIEALCAGIRDEMPGLPWSCETTVNLIDAESVGWMKQAGCTLIQIGVESGNDAMLRRIHKNITIAKALEAARLISDSGITVQTFFMAGFPEETEETLADTRAAIRAIRSDEILFSIFTPYPSTDTFNYLREKGLVADDYDVSLYNHQSPENCFSVHIPRDRFRILMQEMVAEVDALNRAKKRSLVWRLRKRGLLDDFRRKGAAAVVARLGRFLGRLAWSR